MSFDHNDHYHRVLLRAVPQGCRRALDVGCGTGRFARKLAGLGIEVDAFDSDPGVIEFAKAETACTVGEASSLNFRVVDVGSVDLPEEQYDFISCLASLHHMPFDTVQKLRGALTPGGVLVILGCYPERSRADWAWSLAAVPFNTVARLATAVLDKVRPSRNGVSIVDAPVQQPTMSYDEIRVKASILLPGSTMRRLIFWRYLLTYRRPR
ncbi:class I SAM-dependent methyltransferase [Streptomyces sp. NPDC014006]|uniref:class I SAM-dependent methyltransferase n=1 Tax=Streptomyces sp. NPDC014006 TaxID=3364870 RepID=UPI0036F865AB